MVIVILGILAATALPKFVDLSSDAERAAVEGVAGAASSAMAINYAGCSVANNVPAANRCVTVNIAEAGDASAVVGSLMVGGWPDQYGVTCGAATTNGDTSTCTITKSGVTFPTGTKNTFQLIAAGIQPPSQ